MLRESQVQRPTSEPPRNTSCYEIRRGYANEFVRSFPQWALNGTSSSIQARALLVHSVGRVHQLEMCNFSLNSYSGQPRFNILDVSLNL